MTDETQVSRVVHVQEIRTGRQLISACPLQTERVKLIALSVLAHIGRSSSDVLRFITQSALLHDIQ